MKKTILTKTNQTGINDANEIGECLTTLDHLTSQAKNWMQRRNKLKQAIEEHINTVIDAASSLTDQTKS